MLRATLLKPHGEYVGYAGLYPADAPAEANLAFALAYEHWNEGLATEDGNAASIRVLEKLGFELDRIEPGARTFHHFVLERFS